MPIEMKHVKKSYGDQVVLKDFSLTVPDGGTVCLMGASGAGKTTVLRILAGLVKPDAGEVAGVRAGKVAMVFQEDRLLEWQDAFANVELVLGRPGGVTRPGKNVDGTDHVRHPEGFGDGGAGRAAQTGKRTWNKAARPGKRASGQAALRDFLRLEFAAVGLQDYEGKPISQLSGGMKRRVAIVRAVCADSELLLLDEPFTGLDEATKGQVVRYIRERTAGKTVVLVTHDVQDAKALGAQIIRCGVGTPGRTE